jgi:hypothetical protein
MQSNDKIANVRITQRKQTPQIPTVQPALPAALAAPALATQIALLQLQQPQPAARPPPLPKYASRHSAKSWNFLSARRANLLNTLFNIRKHKLEEIAKANLLLHQKIRDQATHYSGTNAPPPSPPKSKRTSRCKTLDHTERSGEKRKMLAPVPGFKVLAIDDQPRRRIHTLSVDNHEE